MCVRIGHRSILGHLENVIVNMAGTESPIIDHDT